MTFTFSCNKKDDSAPKYNYDFEIGAIKDLYIAKDGTVSEPVHINTAENFIAATEISLSGLPDEIEYEISPVSNREPFYATLTLKANYPPQGTYPATVTATNTHGITKTRQFNVTIPEWSNCSRQMAGEYNNGKYIVNKTPESDYIITVQETDVLLYFTLDCIDNSMQLSNYESLIPWHQYGRVLRSVKLLGGSFIPEKEITYTYTIYSEYTYHNPPPPVIDTITRTIYKD